MYERKIILAQARIDFAPRIETPCQWMIPSVKFTSSARNESSPEAAAFDKAEGDNDARIEIRRDLRLPLLRLCTTQNCDHAIVAAEP
jgi:hypothetical protein